MKTQEKDYYSLPAPPAPPPSAPFHTATPIDPGLFQPQAEGYSLERVTEELMGAEAALMEEGL